MELSIKRTFMTNKVGTTCTASAQSHPTFHASQPATVDDGLLITVPVRSPFLYKQGL